MRNAGHMKKFVDPGTETGGTEIELPAPSVTTDTPKEGVISEQDPVGGIQQKTQTSSTESSSKRAKESPSQQKRNPYVDERLCLPIAT